MIVSASFLNKEIKPVELIKKFNETNIDYLHVDVMDGKFVKEKTYTMSDIIKFDKISNKKLDVHLMVNNIEKYVNELALLNVEYITFHYEAVKDVNKIIDLIKGYGIKVGISIKPNTKLESIVPYLEKIDLVLIMSVEPGASGQTFMNSVLYKIEALRKIIDEKNINCIISVDGGINEETSKIVHEKGASMLVSGSFIQNDMSKVNLLKNIDKN